MTRPHRHLALAVLGLLALGACAADDGRDELVVFAAASLTDAFEELAAVHEADAPGTRVVLNLAGSQTLAAQVLEGAPADVLATADPTQLARVADAGLLAGPPTTFATNGLAIAVEPGNPRAVTGLADLADPSLAVVLAAPGVPAGAYAAAALAAAGVAVSPVSLELDVRAAITRVVLGEADAALVYASDVVAAGDAVAGVPVDPAVDVRARYPVAVLAGATDPDAAAAFVDLLTSPTGADVLRRHGFGVP